MKEARRRLEGAGERRVMDEVRGILQERGGRALEEARESILHEHIECDEVRSALAHLTSYWHDVTRPALISLACEAVGGDPEVTVPVAKALILISAAVDVHDDIIDRTEARGGLTLVGKFGSEVALLAGDALLFKGLTSLHEMYGKGIPPERIAAVVNMIKELFFELGDAEALELLLRGRLDVQPEELIRVVERKAADVEAYMRVGSTLGGGSKDEVEALGRYGRLLGMLVILKDDIGDMLDMKIELPHRLKKEILPLPLIYAVGKPDVRTEMASILRKEEIGEEDAGRVLELTYGAGGFEKTEELMWSLGADAVQRLDTIPKKEVRRTLELIIKATIPPST